MAQKTQAQGKETPDSRAAGLQYMSGFGNQFESEAVAGSLPRGQNSPQKVAHGLYAEQLSGSAFTAARHDNLRSWLYRIRPSVVQGEFKAIERGYLRSQPFEEEEATPNQLRWDPFPIPKQPTDFLQGLITIAGSGGPGSWRGCAAHVYAINQSMGNRFFYNADGDFLFVPEQGDVRLRTEFGELHVAPGEIAVIPRGIRYQVNVLGGTARGYILENYGPPFKLPTLGLIGSNGLANPRDFLSPVACFEERTGDFQLVSKFQGNLFEAAFDHSPLDVVAWHGNYVPYKYDLKFFNVINTVSFDHPDPSIFTVLSSPSEMPGVANVDFVIFPPRWMVSEHTFRPPYFHRNCMSEYMGLIFGQYDAKAEGFVPGGGSLHNAMSAHGPDADTFEKASNAELKPSYLGDTLAFMFECSLVFRPTKFAMSSPVRQRDYLDCWSGLKSRFRQ
jgi:homogentisate 1,2-dioxygenase